MKKTIIFVLLISFIFSSCSFYNEEDINLLDLNFDNEIYQLNEIEDIFLENYEPDNTITEKDISFLENNFRNILKVGIPAVDGYLGEMNSTYFGENYYAAKQLEKDLGVKVELTYGSYAEISEKLQNDEIDLMTGAIIIEDDVFFSDKDSYDYKFTNAYGTKKYSLFSNTYDKNKVSFYQMSASSVGVLISQNEYVNINKFMKARRTESKSSTALSLDLEELMSNDFDFYYLPHNSTIVKYGYKEIDFLERDFYTSMAFAVSKNADERLIEILNKSNNGIKESNLLSYANAIERTLYHMDYFFTEDEINFLKKYREVPIDVGAQNEYYVGSFYDAKNERFDGQLIVALDRISTLTGLKYDIDEPKPYHELKEAVLENKLDLFVGITENITNIDNLEYSKSIQNQNVMILGYNKEFSNLEDIYKYRVGTVDGFTINNIISDQLKSNDLIYFDTYTDMYRAFKNGELDYFIAFDEYYFYFLNFYNDYSLKSTFTFENTVAKSFAAPKTEDGELLISIINKGLKYIDVDRILNTGFTIGKVDTIFYYSTYVYAQVILIVILFIAIFICYFLFSMNRIKENKALTNVLSNRINQANTLTNTILWSFREDMEYLILTHELLEFYGVDDRDIIVDNGEQLLDIDLAFSKYIRDENFKTDFEVAKYNLENDLIISHSGAFQWWDYGDPDKAKYISFVASTDHNEFFNSFFIITRDITNEYLYETNLEKQVITDDLTKAKNRKTIFHLNPEFLKNKTLVYFDIDNFGQINDNFSHNEGDEILKILVDRIKKLDNVYDVYRMGGDEFLFIMDYFEPSLAKRIINFILYDIKLNDFIFSIQCCFGFYTITDIQSLEESINIVDYTMIKAKENGRNSFVIANDKIIEAYKDKTELEVQLKNAVQNGEIVPFFQPYIDVQTKKVVGIETLARWKKSGKIIPPNSFLTIAHKTGLITNIDMLMFEEAVKFAKYIIDNFEVTKDFSISSNFTGASLVKITPHELLGFTKKIGISPRTIAIEVTEQLLVNDVAVEKINELRSLGFKISLDDFSAGYSSLNRIKMFNLDVLKLDRLLLVDAGLDKTSYEIYKTIVNLGKFLGVIIISEGVETDIHESILLDNSVHIAQGYLYSKPLDKDDFLEYLTKSLKK